MKKNQQLSEKLSRKVRSKVKQCYYNAWKVVERELPDATYVEGMAVLQEVTPIEHGWVELDEEIIDPTLPDQELVYFSGLRFAGRHGLEQAQAIPGMLDCGAFLPIFYRFGWGGVDSPAFRAALVAAYRFAGMKEIAKRYEDYHPGHRGSGPDTGGELLPANSSPCRGD